MLAPPENPTPRGGGSRLLRERGIHLLPNMLTTLALMLGIYAILGAIDRSFTLASQALIGALFLDMVDGSVARMTKTESPFGAQYDSLSDLVSFGIAPAILIYSWTLSNLGSWGQAVAFFYIVCTAIRLARYNIRQNKGLSEAEAFRGLPSPGASLVLATSVLAFTAEGQLLRQSQQVSILVAGVVVFVSLLMVSNVPYPSLKASQFRSKVSYVSLVVIGIGGIVVLLAPSYIYLIVALAYIVYGLIWGLLRVLRQPVQGVPAPEVLGAKVEESGLKGKPTSEEPH